MKTLYFTVLVLLAALLTACGSGGPEQEEYVQDPAATAENTPDVSEPIGVPSPSSSLAVKAFALSLRIGEEPAIAALMLPPGYTSSVPLREKLPEMLKSPPPDSWDSSAEPLPANWAWDWQAVKGFIGAEEILLEIIFGEETEWWRFEVVQTNLGWYLYDYEVVTNP